MNIDKSYVFYDQDGNLWECEFGSCDIIPNPQNMWNGIAKRIFQEDDSLKPDKQKIKKPKDE